MRRRGALATRLRAVEDRVRTMPRAAEGLSLDPVFEGCRELNPLAEQLAERAAALLLGQDAELWPVDVPGVWPLYDLFVERFARAYPHLSWQDIDGFPERAADGSWVRRSSANEHAGAVAR